MAYLLSVAVVFPRTSFSAEQASSKRESQSYGLATVEGNLTLPEIKIVEHIDSTMPNAIRLLKELVDINSGTLNLTGVRQVGEMVRSRLQSMGFTTTWVDLPLDMGRAGHLIATHPGNGKRLLLIGHLDTVFEPSPQNKPFAIIGNKAIGNGVQDMKGGIVAILQALEALHSVGALTDQQISIVFTGDEEKAGRPTAISRKALVDIAKASDFALGFEFGSKKLSDTAIVARRGISRWLLEVSSRSGHSSKIFHEEMGQGAILSAVEILGEFKHAVVESNGATFNPGIILGGTEVNYEQPLSKGNVSGKANVIADKVVIEGDLRFTSDAQEKFLRKRMFSITQMARPHTNAKITFIDGYPAMPNTKGNRVILDKLNQISLNLGTQEITAQDYSERGAADVSFVASYLPVLDGLGAIGDGAHTTEEYLDLTAFPMVIKRAALLIYRLGKSPQHR